MNLKKLLEDEYARILKEIEQLSSEIRYAKAAQELRKDKLDALLLYSAEIGILIESSDFSE